MILLAVIDLDLSTHVFRHLFLSIAKVLFFSGGIFIDEFLQNFKQTSLLFFCFETFRILRFFDSEESIDPKSQFSGSIYTNTVSFVTASISMRLNLPFTRHRSCYRNRVDLKSVPKVERFQNDTVSSVL